MNKRLTTSIIVLSLILAILGGWYYLAQRFESFVNHNIKKFDSAISYESVEINKYSFKAVFKNLSVNNEFKADEVVVRQVPITSVVGFSVGGKLQFIDGKTKEALVNGENNGLVIWVSKSLFNHDKMNFNVNIQFDKAAFYNSKTQKKIIELSKGYYDITHSLLDHDRIFLDVDSDFTLDMLDDMALSEKNKLDPALEEIRNSLLQLFYPTHYTTKLHIEYADSIYRIFDECKSNSKCVQTIASEFFEKNLILNGSHSSKSKYLQDATTFNFSKKELMKLKADWTIQISNEKEIADVVTDAIYPILVTEIKKLHPKVEVNKQEIHNLLLPLISSGKSTAKLDVEQMAKGHNYKGSFAMYGDDSKFKIDGELANETFSGKVYLSDPKPGINSTVDYLDTKLFPFAYKLMDKQYKSPASFSAFKTSLLEVLDLLDKDGAAQEALEFSLHTSAKDNIMINDKKLDALAADPKVKRLIDNALVVSSELSLSATK